MTRILWRKFLREPADVILAFAVLFAWWASLAVALVILEALAE